MKGSRRKSRELALQGLYQWLVSGGEPAEIRSQFESRDEFGGCDAGYLDELWQGVTAQFAALGERIVPALDRPFAEVSPIERAALAIGAFELAHRPEIPYRVAINEAVDLAKAYGGTDGHKYVNGVLDRLAADLRPREVEERRRQRAAR
jgi:N utilization substance protein B